VSLDLDALGREAWRVGLDTYAQVASRGLWLPYHWLTYLARRLEATALKPNGRLVVMAPPRHGKSEITSRWLAAWYLDHHPSHHVLLGSYEAAFARRWGGLVRDYFEAPDSPAWTTVRPDSRAANLWETPEGGGMACAGVGGPFTGRGGHLLIGDDLIKNWDQASSSLMRAKVWDWWISTFLTRMEPGASVILIMTRWHHADVVGQLLEEDGDNWEVVQLPALATGPDELGRVEGEPLCPERFPLEALEDRRRQVGPMIWEGLYQQAPSPLLGSILRRDWWQFYEATPALEEVILSWDLSFKGNATSDFVVGQAWGRAGADRYLLDQVRGRWDFVETLAQMRAFSAKWPQASAVVVEDKANGPAVISALKREIRGLVPYTPTSSKEARVHSISPAVEAGQVHLPTPARSPWVLDLIEEAAAFPRGVNDDQVDALSQALIRWAGRDVRHWYNGFV
jgi:predicted phage terminase large subunit-like protein